MNNHLISAEYIYRHHTVEHITYVHGASPSYADKTNLVRLPAITRRDVLDKFVNIPLKSSYVYTHGDKFDKALFSTKAWENWKDSIYGSCLQKFVAYEGKVHIDVIVNMDKACSQYVAALAKHLNLPLAYVATDIETNELIVNTGTPMTAEKLREAIVTYIHNDYRDVASSKLADDKFLAYYMSLIVFFSQMNLTECIDYVAPLETPMLKVKQ